MANASIDGLASGLDTSTIISQLMAIERQPQSRLSDKIRTTNSLITVQQALNSRLAALKDAAATIGRTSGWQSMQATSSDTSFATVSASSTALPGSLSFVIDRLATAHSKVSANSLAGLDASVVTSGTDLIVGSAGALGISTMTGSAGFAGGAHTIEATQSSAAAAHTGAALGPSITIGVGETLEIDADGGGAPATTDTIVLTAGTYDRDSLAAMVEAASGGLLTATVTDDDELQIATLREGSAANLAITGGTAMATLGFSATANATGTDGVITVDGVATTITDLVPGNGVVSVLDAAAGETLSVRFSGGIHAGTATINNIDFGDGSLAAVVAGINAANEGVSATAVQVSPGQYKMQLTATQTGVVNAIDLDVSQFTAALGAFSTVVAAQDAQVTVGSGGGAYQVTSPSNSAELMAGVTVNLLKADPAKTVTVTSGRDTNALAGKVQSIVTAYNSAISYIVDGSKYDATTKTGGPLMSDSSARQITNELYGALGSATSGTTLSSVGLTIDKNGLLTFDAAKFVAAYNADPAAVQTFFGDNGAGALDDGLATRLETVAKNATDSVTGLITVAITGNKSTVERLQSQVDEWDRRLALKETKLRKTYSALESALGQLQSRSNWLAGQITQLNANSNSG